MCQRTFGTGVLWALKHQPAVLDDVTVRVALRREWASHSPLLKPNLQTSFERYRVAIETTDGRVVEERLQPRDSFVGHGLDTPWNRLQLAYFAGYAMWTYLTTPFPFAMDGVATEELEPWRENGEMWRRLKVTFPPRIATHSTVQIFYFDSEGLLTRHDYDAEVLGGSPAAHYVHDFARDWMSRYARVEVVADARQARRIVDAIEQYLRASESEPALLELVKVRASLMNGCAYCVDLHTKDARAKGETEQRLFAVPVWRETPFFSPRERAALAWTEAVTGNVAGRAGGVTFEGPARQVKRSGHGTAVLVRSFSDLGRVGRARGRQREVS